MAALTIASVPLWVVVFRRASGHRVARAARWWGSSSASSASPACSSRPASQGTIDPLSLAILVVAALSWASGSYLATLIAMPRDPFVSTAAQMLAASAVLVVAGLAIGERPDLAVAQAHPDSVLALAYLIVFGSLLAFTAYAWVLQHWPISRVATYAYVNPLVAVVLGGLILGEPLTVPILLGRGRDRRGRGGRHPSGEPARARAGHPGSRLALPSALDMDLPALLVLAAILAVKETGVPIPVPGDLLVIGAGVASTRGGLPVPAVVIVLVAATVVGGIVQFTLIRGRARAAVLGLLARVGLGAAVVERGAGRLRTGGAPAVAVARMTPGVRIVAIASSAVAGVASTSFLAGLIVGNGVFLTGHFILGLVVGEPAVQLVAGRRDGPRHRRRRARRGGRRGLVAPRPPSRPLPAAHGDARLDRRLLPGLPGAGRGRPRLEGRPDHPQRRLDRRPLADLPGGRLARLLQDPQAAGDPQRQADRPQLRPARTAPSAWPFARAAASAACSARRARCCSPSRTAARNLVVGGPGHDLVERLADPVQATGLEPRIEDRVAGRHPLVGPVAEPLRERRPDPVEGRRWSGAHPCRSRRATARCPHRAHGRRVSRAGGRREPRTTPAPAPGWPSRRATEAAGSRAAQLRTAIRS